MRLVAGGLMSLVVVGLLLAAGTYRARYTSWPWQGEPFRLHYCDRIYDRFPGGPRGTPTTERPPDHHLVFRAPPVIGRQVLVRDDAPCGARLVPTEVYRAAGGGRYRIYALLGGP